MNTQKSLKTNFIMNAILTMSSFIFPLITFPYVSRVLLPEGTGKVSFAISVVSYFALFAQLGIPTYGVRTCAKVRDDKDKLSKTVHEIFVINLIMSVVAYLAFFVALIYIPKLSQDKTLFIIASTTIVFNLIGIEWLYKSLEQYTYITIRSIVFKFIALLAMFALIHQKSDYIIYAGISIFAASASSVLNFINARKYIKFCKYENYNFKAHLKPISIFFAMACATTIYTHMDTVMLGFMKTNVDVGYYNAAVKIKAILLSIVTSLGVVLLPRASYYIERGLKDEFLRITQKALNFVFLLATPLMIYFIIFAKEGIFFLSGTLYQGSIIPMQIIMPTILIIGLTNIMGIQMLIPMGKEKIVLYSEIAGAVVNLIINFVLIPKMASTGAAIGTLVAEIVVFVVQYLYLKDIVLKSYKNIKYKSILLAILIGALCSIWLKYLSISSFLTLLISAIIFFGLYAISLTVSKEPLFIDIEKQVFSKIKNVLVKNK